MIMKLQGAFLFYELSTDWWIIIFNWRARHHCKKLLVGRCVWYRCVELWLSEEVVGCLWQTVSCGRSVEEVNKYYCTNTDVVQMCFFYTPGVYLTYTATQNKMLSCSSGSIQQINCGSEWLKELLNTESPNSHLLLISLGLQQEPEGIRLDTLSGFGWKVTLLLVSKI